MLQKDCLFFDAGSFQPRIASGASRIQFLDLQLQILQLLFYS